MAFKKFELYRSLWSSSDELRGRIDASQYKDYVLTLLFVKYVLRQVRRARARVGWALPSVAVVLVAATVWALSGAAVA